MKPWCQQVSEECPHLALWLRVYTGPYLHSLLCIVELYSLELGSSEVQSRGRLFTFGVWSS